VIKPEVFNLVFRAIQNANVDFLTTAQVPIIRRRYV
jgi:hypothetical protein